MCPQAQLTGLHPRSEKLIGLTRAFDRGRTSWDEVETQLGRETEELIRLQDELGFDPVSDGGLAWQDLLRPLAKSLGGVSLGTRYSRWFDTNTFYQKPIINGKVAPKDFHFRDFLWHNGLPRDRKWKVTIPGPYTFSELSENRHYEERASLLDDLADAECMIARRLVDAGVSHIQLSEPCLVYRPYRENHLRSQEIDSALKAVAHVVKGVQASFTVHTFFGDPSPVLESLLELPLDAVGIDLFEMGRSKLDLKTSKSLVLGIVDGRESQIEGPNWIAEKARTISRHARAEEIILAPSSDLRFLPREIADRKLEALAEATRIMGGIL